MGTDYEHKYLGAHHSLAPYSKRGGKQGRRLLRGGVRAYFTALCADICCRGSDGRSSVMCAADDINDVLTLSITRWGLYSIRSSVPVDIGHHKSILRNDLSS